MRGRASWGVQGRAIWGATCTRSAGARVRAGVTCPSSESRLFLPPLTLATCPLLRIPCPPPLSYPQHRARANLRIPCPPAPLPPFLLCPQHRARANLRMLDEECEALKAEVAENNAKLKSLQNAQKWEGLDGVCGLGLECVGIGTRSGGFGQGKGKEARGRQGGRMRKLLGGSETYGARKDGSRGCDRKEAQGGGGGQDAQMAGRVCGFPPSVSLCVSYQGRGRTLREPGEGKDTPGRTLWEPGEGKDTPGNTPGPDMVLCSQLHLYWSTSMQKRSWT